MAAPPLPTPRALLTALLDTLSLVPGEEPTRQQQQQPRPQQQQQQQPALPQRLPPSARPLLTTLHTLYPRLLLPALDLLDRRLVLRVLADRNTTNTILFYHVRSAQEPPAGRRRRGRAAAAAAEQTATASAPVVYVVRTGAWSCSCAPFALSAFPAGEAAASSSSSAAAYAIRAAADADHDDVDVDEGAAAAAVDREFGGRSRDGRPAEAGGVGTGDVPCCKHLLACVLAERWDVLGPYVEERRVGPEEAAGLVTGGA